MKELKIACAQIDLALGDKKVNLEKASKFASMACDKNADVICYPEYLTTGYASEKINNLAEPIPGPSIEKLQSIAEENNICIVASLAEVFRDKLYNTGIFIDSEGKLLGKYRKVHLFHTEPNYFQRGNEYVTFDTKFGKVGLMICYDAIFPEAARALALEGAEIIFMPANWPEPFIPQWLLATGARALDNQVWVAAVNRVGTDDTFTYFGRSRIVDPYGNPAVECSGNNEEIIIVKLEPKKSEEFKNTVNFLQDRQPKTYTRIFRN
ncbi:MAG: carbon-nitrogen hydrolase family protein [Candidatus Thermoplasmatota archaeon]|nr:carbon-nitrogen hydrolase family protein [Candidatus Thermoplasmatota archaeon]